MIQYIMIIIRSIPVVFSIKRNDWVPLKYGLQGKILTHVCLDPLLTVQFYNICGLCSVDCGFFHCC